MRNFTLARFYTYDFTRLFVALGFTLAIAVIVYSALFGSIF
ncbi:membrane protein [Sinorhizobium sp. GL28]|nr:membrane protein [Sinorhizobium sp. Sb3]KSV95974.1 membrane protein [Sinorhizobium sp. GL28]